MTESAKIIEMTERYSAKNYDPLPIVISKAEGVWVEDPEGKKYMDMLSCYSALNQGHRHPKIIKALKEQADRVTLTSRAFHNDQLGKLCEMLCKLTGKNQVLPMNTGAEAVETALKAMRRWAYEVKKVPQDKAEIIVCANNFHGRTLTAISMSSEPAYREDFGPFTPGFKIIPYGDLESLKSAINENTAAFLLEPIQGEAGIIIPFANFLKEAVEICHQSNVLFVADEVQTGFGRTGKMFACDWENVVPDMYILGKALGGGVYPVSAIVADKEILGLFEPGSHGSTFGGNPLACAVAIAAIQVILEENLAERSRVMGEFLVGKLKKIPNSHIKEIRGKGLFVGLELDVKARPYCEALKEEGVLCKETHDNIIRFAPPLVISKEELEWAIEKISLVLAR
jgi:ornithine--oxo-acid transaminase